jgi:hypothetical protein
MITGTCVITAGSKDSENLSSVELKVDQIVVDAGYSRGKALKYCEEHRIDAYIPSFGQYKPE